MNPYVTAYTKYHYLELPFRNHCSYHTCRCIHRYTNISNIIDNQIYTKPHSPEWKKNLWSKS